MEVQLLSIRIDSMFSHRDLIQRTSISDRIRQHRIDMYNRQDLVLTLGLTSLTDLRISRRCLVGIILLQDPQGPNRPLPIGQLLQIDL